MVWRCDRNGIDVLAIEQLSKVGYLIEFSTVLLIKRFPCLAEHMRIAIAQSNKLRIESFDMTLTAPVQSDHRHANSAVHVGSGESWHTASRGNAKGILQEDAARLFRHFSSNRSG